MALWPPMRQKIPVNPFRGVEATPARSPSGPATAKPAAGRPDGDRAGPLLLEPVPLKEPIPQEGIGGHRMLGLLVGLGLEDDQAPVRSAKGAT